MIQEIGMDPNILQKQFVNEFKKLNQSLIKSQILMVRKEREKKYDHFLLIQRREERSKFITQQIETRGKYVDNTQIEQKQTFQQSLKGQKKIGVDELRLLTQYEKQIGQLEQSLQQIENTYQEKRKECLPLQRIIQNRLDTLSVISIQYRLKYGQNDQYRYSISAFELFKVVHRNKLLHQVTIKGVIVPQLQQFINLLNQVIHNKPIEQKNAIELSWIKQFRPPKSLKLSINAKVKFDIQNKSCTLSRINDLVVFQSLFCQLSDIIVQVRLGRWIQINQWILILQNLWDCLRGIKKINIELWGDGDSIQKRQVAAVRSALFGGLASFSQITQLSFTRIRLSSQIGINHFLAIEKSLSALFNNNAVTHLELNNCRNFPVLPKITTLESIKLICCLSFRKQCGFMREVTQTSPSLKSIKCSWIYQEWRIEQQLFNRLQTLSIDNSHCVFLGDIFSQLPSKIKHLKIQNSSIGRVDCLSVIFPNLIYLGLSDIDFGHSHLYTIPSPHLEELYIQNNHAIIDLNLRMIDQKWPNLSKIKLRRCSKVTENIWSICKFKGLMELQVGIWPGCRPMSTRVLTARVACQAVS